MPAQIKIFITGVTGYIGGTVLSRLLVHPNRANHRITALVRSQEKANKLNKLGVTTVTGSFKNSALLENAVADADVVISAADSDDLVAIKAILRGSKRHHTATGNAPILIHTSGTGLLTDDAVGDYSTDIIYDDMDTRQIESIPDTALHRDVDLELVKADSEDYVKTYIIVPSMIYGVATGLVAEGGVQNTQSIQIPTLLRASLDRGRAGMVGQGKNIWVNIHIDDIADLYIGVFDAVITSPESIAHGREGFYFGENGESTLYEIANHIGKALVALGKTRNAEPSPFTEEEVQRYLNGYTVPWGTNSRARANRSRAIGWAPTKTTVDLFAGLKPEIEAIIQKNNSEQGI